MADLEGDFSQIIATSAKKGTTVLLDGEPSKVVDINIARPGKHGHAKVRLKAVGLFDDKKREIVLPGHDKLDVPIINKKGAQVLSVTDTHANVMDSESYETFDLEIPEELQGQINSGSEVLYWQVMGKRVLRELKN
jgi:translation initiation factor 5A